MEPRSFGQVENNIKELETRLTKMGEILQLGYNKDIE